MESFSLQTEQVKRPGLLVLLAGMGTTAATLVLLYFLDNAFEDFQLMGFYVNYVLPVGAVVVGLAAGSGYGLASWLTGAKINRGLLVTVIVLQIAAYFVAQYVEYVMVCTARGEGIRLTFWEYFDTVTRAFAWHDHGKPGKPFGAWGYGIRALEIAGFVLGGIVAPAILFALPYCDKCQAYMRGKELGLLAAGVPARKIKKKNTAALKAQQQQHQEALDRGLKVAEQLVGAAQANDAQAFAKLLAEHARPKKEANQLTSRIAVSLQRCPRCASGNLLLRLMAGQGEEQSTAEIARCEVGPQFVQDLGLYRA